MDFKMQSFEEVCKAANTLHKKYGLLFSSINLTAKYDKEKGKFKKTPRDVLSFEEREKLTRPQVCKKGDHNAVTFFTGGDIILVDVDSHGKKEFMELVKKENIDITNTLLVMTPSKGFHVYYKLNETQKLMLEMINFKSSDSGIIDGVDIKYKNGLGFFGLVAHDGGVAQYAAGKPPEQLAELPMAIFKKIMKLKSIKQSSPEVVVAPANEEKVDFVKQLLSLLKPERCDNREDWLRIGAICFNEGISYSVFDEWSKKSKKYDTDSNLKTWNSFKSDRDDKITVKTLKLYAETDNPVSFRELFVDIKTKPFPNTKDYKELKRYFEARVVRISNPPVFMKYNELWDKWEIVDERALCHAFIKLEYEYETQDKTVTNKFVNRWLKDINALTYDYLDFIPPESGINTRNLNIFNQYDGMKAENLLFKGDVTKDMIQPFLKHVSILSNNEEATADYMLKWLAHIVQKPGQLNGIALVFKSKQGSGKNTLIDWFGKDILGKKYWFDTAKPDVDLFGRFSCNRQNKFLIVVNEVSGKHTYEHAGLLKDMITNNTTTIEQKGKDPIQCHNYARLIFTTNNELPIKVEPSDRRFVLIKCSDEKKGDIAYFKELVKWLSEEENQWRVYTYLKNLDIETVDWINDRPKTTFYEDVKAANLPTFAYFLKHLVTERKLTKSEPQYRITASKLWDSFQTFIGNNKIKNDMNSMRFYTCLKNEFDEILIRSNPKNKATYTMNYDTVINYLIENNLIEGDMDDDDIESDLFLD